MEKQRILFLDLEQTIIDVWQDANIIQVQVPFIKEVIRKFKPEHIGIFSFAIDNESDKEHFRNRMQDKIEMAIGMKITWKHIMSTSEMIKLIKKLNHTVAMDAVDFFTWFNKEKALIDCLKASSFQGRACLIDDTVDDSIFVDRNMSILFKHI